MTDAAITIALAAFGVALLLNLLRLAKGPTIADRILALDTMVINGIVLLVLFGIRYGTTLYFEVAMLLAMVGFVSTVALCRFVLRGDVIE